MEWIFIYKYYGRTTIYANYTEQELLSGTWQDQVQKIINVLKDSKFQTIHNENRTETLYLIDYKKGKQDIQYKEKKTRTDINNKSVENWAYACIDWKKTFLLGKPVKYAPANDVANEEIIELNKYNTYEDKNNLDSDIWDDVLTCGRGFRYINKTPISSEDEAPFEIVNLDPWNTEVVYSSSINKEQLFAYVQTQMVEYKDVYNIVTKETDKVEIPYNEYTVYTRNYQFVINDKDSIYKISKKPVPLLLNEHIVIEYYANKERMSLIELGKDIFDDINYIENLDLDDIEQFVNSIMVFTNAEVTADGMDSIKEYGAVSIKSTEQKQAKVEILQSRLKSLDTQIYYLRKLSALHSILSIPQANNNGTLADAETGKALLTGQGFTSASIRVEGEDLAFKKCDKRSLKTELKICKKNKNSLIKNLNVSDIEIKLSRDLSENLLVKTQALTNLMSANIPPEIRNQVVNLFSDPTYVTKLQKKYEDELKKTKDELNSLTKSQNTSTKSNEEQNNTIQDTTSIQEQNQ